MLNQNGCSNHFKEWTILIGCEEVTHWIHFFIRHSSNSAENEWLSRCSSSVTDIPDREWEGESGGAIRDETIALECSCEGRVDNGWIDIID